MEKTIALLPGDGIGPEIVASAVHILKEVARVYGHTFQFETGLIGGIAYDETGVPLPEATVQLCQKADAILLGAVGGPKYDGLPKESKPETGLLGIRKRLDLYANLRPVTAYETLLDASPLKEARAKGVDFVIVRELSSGIYFGQPSERREEEGRSVVVDTLYYTAEEIERIVVYAFELAAKRRGKLTSVDKANVLESSRVWRETVERVRTDYPSVEVEHMLVDNAAMQLILNPAQFDVVVTENMFGDILSDIGSVLTGSIGVLPSASISANGVHLYEPIHGSAPTIAGLGIANPIATILSAAMLLRLSFGLQEEAAAIEAAVDAVLEARTWTRDLDPNSTVSTEDMTNAILRALQASQRANV
ncbi:MAG: 3-isopropylmalate dehydrogenase [Bacilli bacterium]